MKKNFKIYAICWLILLALFNVLCFVTPVTAGDMYKFGGAFWAGYAFITVAFIGQLICAYFALKPTDLKKVFLNMPIISISYAGLVLTIVFGGLFMVLPNVPNYIAIIICFAILAFNAIALLKSTAAAKIVSRVDEDIKAQTAFIKTLTVSAEIALNKAVTNVEKAECKKVYEAVRYSDPVSVPALSRDEEQIANKLDELSKLIGIADNEKQVISLSSELINLLKERNAKIKAFK